MIKLDEKTIEKIEEALNKKEPIRILLEKNLKGTITMEVSERSLLELAHA